MPESGWWTEAERIADRITGVVEASGAGGTLPAVACLLALKRALDTGFDDLSDVPENLVPLKKVVSKAISDFAALAGKAEG